MLCPGQGRYARSVPPELFPDAVVLVLDTCSERASVALFRGDRLLGESLLAERTASAIVLGAVRAVLAAQGLRLGDVAAIGVVSGPGSFTGVRVGLAVAKGLCEAANLPLATVSRLAVLAESAGVSSGFALLGAGREEVYLRAADGREWLASLAELEPLLHGAEIAVTSSELGTRLAGTTREVQVVELSARHAMAAVRRCLLAGGTELALADANYVRNEEAIYRRARPEAKTDLLQAESDAR